MKLPRLIAFAIEAGIPKEHFTSELFKFATFLIEDEREACAKVCEDSVEYAGDTLADAIRARGQE
jgi:hypothetical protein